MKNLFRRGQSPESPESAKSTVAERQAGWRDLATFLATYVAVGSVLLSPLVVYDGKAIKNDADTQFNAANPAQIFGAPLAVLALDIDKKIGFIHPNADGQ